MHSRSETPNEAEPTVWDAGPIIDWLLEEGRLLPDIYDLTRCLGEKMLAAGAPVWRVRLSMRTLHPLVAAVTAMWERDQAEVRRIQAAHGLEGRSGYIGSPLEIIGRTQAPFRVKLAGVLSERDHSVLHELKAQGGTDYYGVPLFLLDGASANLVFTTDSTPGFSQADLAHFKRIASVLAPITDVYRSRNTSYAVAEAYLGPRTGRRVLDGRITRGDIETIDAAVLVSDIRDWTGLNARLSASETLGLANRYFEIVAEAVEANGGEVLKFLGDGILAVFPTDKDGTDASAACRRALVAARQALANAGNQDPPLDLAFGIGLHFGKVLYGNIGSQTRLDFTVLGQAVNIAARIEGLCAKHGKPVLVSGEFAERVNETLSPVAREVLKGQAGETGLYTVSDHADLQ